MKIDKRTVNTMQRMYKAVDEKWAAYAKEQQKLEQIMSEGMDSREQIQVCSDAQTTWVKEREKADNYVRQYMKRHEVDGSIEKMEALIGVMPESFFRYLLFRQMQDLKV